jgi:ATP-binding cassette subfamily B protein
VHNFLLQNPILLLLRRGWQHAGQYRPAAVLYTAIFLLAQVSYLAEPYVIGRMLNIMQTDLVHSTKSGAQVWSEVSFYLWIWFWLQLAFWVFHGPGRVLERYVAFHMCANYKKHLFDIVLQLPLKWHRMHHSGESIDKINRATNSLSYFFDNSFEVSYMIFRLFGSLVVLFWFMPSAGWIALAATAASFVNVFLWDTFMAKQYTQLNEMGNKVASAIHDYISNIVSVITLRLQKRVAGEVDRRIFAQLPLFKNNSVVNEVKWFFITASIAVMTVFVLIRYAEGELHAGHVLMAGTFFTLFEYLRRVGESFYNFGYLYGSVVKQATDVASADTILTALAETDRTEDHEMPENWRRVEVTGLQFRYEDEEHREHHLKDIRLTLQRAKSIAFVGASGSGKSTLLALLRGLQDADAAHVLIDGKDLPGKLRHLSAHTTLIPQDPEIFADTIRFNITFGLDASDSTVMRAVELARFDTVLARLPKGLDTNIAEKGVNLSGGEKQRLALARGLFFAKDSDFVLLDEPTSSVDTLNERLIYENVLAECAQKCVVSSVHKLHLLEMFDEIYVFDDGELAEHGTLQELLADDSGVLSKMWSSYQRSSLVAEVLEPVN